MLRVSIFWRDLQVEVDSERQIFHGNLNLLSEFLPEICWKEIANRKKYFLYHNTTTEYSYEKIFLQRLSRNNKLPRKCSQKSLSLSFGVDQVVCWLIRRQDWIRIPGQASKRNMEKNISLAISSQQISGKNLHFFIVSLKLSRSKSTLNRTKLTHTTRVVWEASP